MTTPSVDCPVFSLQEAIRRIEMIYNEVQDHPANKSDIADAMQYNSIHGTYYLMISAFTQYGLIETVGDRLKVSAEAKKLLPFSRVTPEERLGTLKQAAFAPSLFNELHNYYSNTIPSNIELKEFFRRKEVPQSKIDGAVRAYRDTIQFVNEQAKIAGESGSSGTPTSPQTFKHMNSDISTRSSLPLSSLQDEKKETEFRFSDPFGEIYIKISGAVTSERFQHLIEFAHFQQKLLPRVSE